MLSLWKQLSLSQDFPMVRIPLGRLNSGVIAIGHFEHALFQFPVNNYENLYISPDDLDQYCSLRFPAVALEEYGKGEARTAMMKAIVFWSARLQLSREAYAEPFLPDPDPDVKLTDLFELYDRCDQKLGGMRPDYGLRLLVEHVESKADLAATASTEEGRSEFYSGLKTKLLSAISIFRHMPLDECKTVLNDLCDQGAQCGSGKITAVFSVLINAAESYHRSHALADPRDFDRVLIGLDDGVQQAMREYLGELPSEQQAVIFRQSRLLNGTEIQSVLHDYLSDALDSGDMANAFARAEAVYKGNLGGEEVLPSFGSLSVDELAASRRLGFDRTLCLLMPPLGPTPDVDAHVYRRALKMSHELKMGIPQSEMALGEDVHQVDVTVDDKREFQSEFGRQYSLAHLFLVLVPKIQSTIADQTMDGLHQKYNQVVMNQVKLAARMLGVDAYTLLSSSYDLMGAFDPFGFGACALGAGLCKTREVDSDYVMSQEDQFLGLLSAHDDAGLVAALSDVDHDVLRALSTRCLFRLAEWAVRSDQVAILKSLLEFDKGLLEDFDSDGNTLLHVAASWNRLAAIELLVHEGADIDAESRSKKTPVFVAAGLDQLEAFKLLKSLGANLDITDYEGRCVYKEIGSHGSLRITEYLYRDDVTLFEFDRPGNSVLESAVSEGRLDVLKFFQKEGFFDSLNTFELACIAVKKGQESVLRWFASLGFDLTGVSGVTDLGLFHYAAGYGAVSIVPVLIELGLDINQTNPKNNTPIMIAATLGRLDMVQTLYEQGADMTVRNQNHLTLLHAAVATGRSDVVRYLCSGGPAFDKEIKTPKGTTPLYLAVVLGKLGPVQVLVELGADMSVVNSKGLGLLQVCCEKGWADIASYLLDQESILSSITSGSFSFADSPLGLAISKGHLPVIDVLYEKCPELFNSEDYLYQIVTIASRNSKPECVRALVEKGMNFYGCMKTALAERDVDGVKFLLDAGVSLYPSGGLSAKQKMVRMVKSPVRKRIAAFLREVDQHASYSTLLSQLTDALRISDRHYVMTRFGLSNVSFQGGKVVLDVLDRADFSEQSFLNERGQIRVVRA